MFLIFQLKFEMFWIYVTMILIIFQNITMDDLIQLHLLLNVVFHHNENNQHAFVKLFDILKNVFPLLQPINKSKTKNYNKSERLKQMSPKMFPVQKDTMSRTIVSKCQKWWKTHSARKRFGYRKELSDQGATFQSRVTNFENFDLQFSKNFAKTSRILCFLFFAH